MNEYEFYRAAEDAGVGRLILEVEDENMKCEKLLQLAMATSSVSSSPMGSPAALVISRFLLSLHSKIAFIHFFLKNCTLLIDVLCTGTTQRLALESDRSCADLSYRPIHGIHRGSGNS